MYLNAGSNRKWRLRKGNMILRIGNEAKVDAEAVGIYSLRLPSNFRLDLNDCYFVPVTSQNLISVSVLASQNVISVSMLAQEGFEINFNEDFCFIYLRNKLDA